MLKDLLVLELASVLAGPSVGQWLAELGARVIKVENVLTGGDVTRSWRLPSEPEADDRSAYFSAVNWGKESIALDLRESSALALVQRIACQADIVLSSYLPSQAKRLGVDEPTLRSLNPRLIWAAISGYGQESERPAFDAVIQAEAGFTYLNGTTASTHKMPVALMDVLAAHHLKEAILLALLERKDTGLGRSVHVSLLDAGMSSLANQATNWLVAGQVPQPSGSDHPNIVPYGTLFHCQDDQQIVLAVGNDAQFQRLCEVIGETVPARFSSNPMRVRHRQAVNDWLASRFRQHPREMLLDALQRASIPAGAVRDMQQVFETEQARRIMLHAGDLRGLRQMVAKGLGEISSLSPPPRLHEHGEAIRSDQRFMDLS